MSEIAVQVHFLCSKSVGSRMSCTGRIGFLGHLVLEVLVPLMIILELVFCSHCRTNPVLRLKASRISPELTKEAENIREKMSEETLNVHDPFCDVKQRFLSFKKDVYL